MRVQNAAVHDIEDVARDDRTHCHSAPVDAQARSAEGIGHEGGVDAEKSAVAQSCESREPEELVWVLDCEAGDLGEGEDEGGGDEGPVARGMEALDYDVASDAG